jgi:hypothetical protein
MPDERLTAESVAPELLLFLRVPGATMGDDAEAFAREIVAILNEERERNEGSWDSRRVEVTYAAWSKYQRAHLPPVEGCQCPRCLAASEDTSDA